MVPGTGLTASSLRQLRHLANLYGVQTAYLDVSSRRRHAGPEALLAVLGALGAPVETLRDVPEALRAQRRELWQRACEPVIVAWDGHPAAVDLRLPASTLTTALTCHLHVERGEVRRWTVDPGRLATVDAAEVEGQRYVVKRLPLPEVPWGYHRLTIHTRGRRLETLIIAAPRRAFPLKADEERTWGVFLPLYALRSRRGWGAGDLSDLDDLMEWVAGLGGGAVATLPLLAAFLDEPFDPSPFSPASRLFWNEFYLDVTRSPELERCPAAQALLRSPALQSELAALRASSQVDYRRAMRAKQGILEELARCFFSGPSPRQATFRRFAETHPALEDYARFRAVCDRQRTPWQQWPVPLRDGVVHGGDYDEDARRYHLYVQWLADQQLRTLSEKARRRGVGLLLDLPLGAHAAGYDVWREREAFAPNISVGAPPDVFFTGGQNWGFPPLHPNRLREQAYRYYIGAIRHQLQFSSILRIDHVMGFHRLFWIPHGLEARQGVYVCYPAEEFYAILTLESHRHRAVIVGEDLGTVPPAIRRSMTRHNIHRTYVVQYERARRGHGTLRPIPADALAGLNTHDMPPFTAFWKDLQTRHRRALLSFLRRGGWLRKGRASVAQVLPAILTRLAASRARIVIVNLEDLWFERRRQNVPGTGFERPNWRRKARYALETFSRRNRILEMLREVNRMRRERRAR